MHLLKHIYFHQWAYSEGISDRVLRQAIDEIDQGLFEASLGSGLYKKRIASLGKGKSGGYRTLLAFKKGDIACFVFGFSKNAKANITEKEQQIYRKLAKEILRLDSKIIKLLLKQGKLIEVT